MKKMTNKWWLVPGALAVFVAPALVSCDDDKETIEVVKEVVTEVVTPGAGIDQFTVSAVGGDTEVGIAPTADWSVVSKAEWLTVSPASGTKDDKKLILTAEPNTAFESRSAILELTVGDTLVKKTVVQEGLQRSITIFGDTIFFSAQETEFKVSPIVANVEVKVDEEKLPAWVKGVNLSLHQDGYYEAVVTLNVEDYDNEKRYGEISFKDAASDYAVTFPIVCAATEMGPRGYATNITSITLEGEGGDFPLDVILSPESTEDTILAYIRGAIKYESLYDFWTQKNALTATPAASTAVALKRHSWNIHVEPWDDEAGDQTRALHVFVVSKEEAADFNPNQQVEGGDYKPNLIITQKNNNMIKKVIRVEGTVSKGNTIKVKLHKDYASGVKMVIANDCYKWQSDPFANSYIDTYKIEVEQQGAEMEDEYIVYTFQITAIGEGASGFYFYALALDANGNYVRDDGGNVIYAVNAQGYDLVVN